MGVKVRKKGAKWYVLVDYQGRRKSKCVGSREALRANISETLPVVVINEQGEEEKN